MVWNIFHVSLHSTAGRIKVSLCEGQGGNCSGCCFARSAVVCCTDTLFRPALSSHSQLLECWWMMGLSWVAPWVLPFIREGLQATTGCWSMERPRLVNCEWALWLLAEVLLQLQHPLLYQPCFPTASQMLSPGNLSNKLPARLSLFQSLLLE